MGQISLRRDGELKCETPLCVAGEIDDAAFENGRVGYANVIPVKAQQNRRSRGQADDLASVASDLDRIIGAKGLADRKHDGCDEIFNSITNRKADSEPNNARSAQDTGQECRSVHDIKSNDQTADDKCQP